MAGEDESVARGLGGSEDDSVAQNGGDLGYFSVFQMVPVWNAAYTTEWVKYRCPYAPAWLPRSMWTAAMPG